MKAYLKASLAMVSLYATGALAQSYPLTIEHKFGVTVIEQKPDRVASLDYNGADNLLELGVQPVTVRYWSGDYENSITPWAQPLLTTKPIVLRGDLDFEAIAATDPDVILAIWSGISAEEYEKLSKIAPVVAVPEGVGNYAMPWDDLALRAGLAVGELEQAETKVEKVRGYMAEVAARNPDWAGKTVSVAHLWDQLPGAYTAEDLRVRIMTSLGFVNAPEIDKIAKPGNFKVKFSEEELGRVDADVVIWFMGGSREDVENLSLYPSLRAAKEGRSIFTNDDMASAFGYASLVSLPYVIDLLEPKINAAIDGDPSTQVPE